jgi:(heptosyl)LPS beta-1,4-glucosyltransferase
MVTWKKEIHSQPETRGNGLTLMDSEKLSIKHYNYTSVVQFVYRAIRYSGIQADELKTADYKVKTSDFFLKPVQEFNSRFFAAEGYKDGVHGLVFSILQAFAIALVYIRLWEKQGAREKTLAKESFVSASLETTFEYNFWFTKYFLQEYSKNILKNILIRLRFNLDRLTKNF